MKTSVEHYFPFAVYAETKISKAGNKYTSIGVCQKSKDKDGNNVKTYFNMLDKRDLLVLGNLCIEAYKNISFAEHQEKFANGTKKEQVQEKKEEVNQEVENIDDEIPF